MRGGVEVEEGLKESHGLLGRQPLSGGLWVLLPPRQVEDNERKRQEQERQK